MAHTEQQKIKHLGKKASSFVSVMCLGGIAFVASPFLCLLFTDTISDTMFTIIVLLSPGNILPLK